ncbi:hypothetical protein B0A54_15814 [Friedmanniomyces endolithicus]|uniref:Uncharacterized protein n=1 Tax=Friedmanniomyces endolithicus TaxID=329885 RepID=A0A4U0U5U6_9PEZI|nr:hypothetical protein LTS09_009248 [Friedmanniomyces endolithicus]TKA30520.1 hypothetical protein B0A54_15814 [Friedmanniomyces endolithicus]
MAKSERMDLFSPNAELTTEQRVIYATNATASPLLFLPAELRGRVWLAMLGGQTIHIPPPLLSFCPLSGVLSVVDRDYTLHLKAVGEGTLSQRSHHSFHHLCARANGWRMDVDVLKVCHLIYDEAALLPFSSDHSFFAADASLADILHHTLPSQARSIMSISLVLSPRSGSWQHLDVTTPNTLLGWRELISSAEVSQASPLLQAGRFAL